MVEISTDTKPTQKFWMPMVSIPIVGLLWSLAVVWLNAEELAIAGLQPIEAFMYVALGGLAQTIAFWAGFSAVVWAMVRAFSGRIAFTQLFSLVSSASWPFWVGAPAAAYWLHSDTPLAALAGLIFALSLCAFLYNTSQLLAHNLNWFVWRSLAATSSAAVFLSCFAFLTN